MVTSRYTDPEAKSAGSSGVAPVEAPIISPSPSFIANSPFASVTGLESFTSRSSDHSSVPPDEAS